MLFPVISTDARIFMMVYDISASIKKLYVNCILLCFMFLAVNPYALYVKLVQRMGVII